MASTSSDLILIVDDNPANLKLLFRFLKESGFKVLVASDGESAIAKVEQVLPDLILLDVMMPGLDGFETCDRIKKNPLTQDIPIIFMTALSELDSKVKGLNLGAVDYITKPFYQQEVLSRINLHLQLRQLNQALNSQNQQLLEEIKVRKSVEGKLRQLTQDLEQRVEQRTRELASALTDLEAQKERLSYEASHDTLTNLANRTLFVQHLSAALTQSKNDFAVLFLDLDRFKSVNDSLGHLVGDELLKAVARRLRNCIDDGDEIARLGGDEFAILVSGDRDRATTIAREILTQLQTPFFLGNYRVSTDASIGIVGGDEGYRNAIDVLRDADVAMYRAKKDGRGRFAVLTPEMQVLSLARLKLERDLPRALERQEFCLHYQPILNLQTKGLLGFEALIRWQHPERGLLFPGKFIVLTEETGFIQPLGDWILKTASEQLRQWQDRYDRALMMNANVSPIQLLQWKTDSTLESLLDSLPVELSRLKLEITESCFVEETSTAKIQILEQLHDRGIRLCIDDFGTGYSSLSRLHSFPIDTLKIDRSFVNNLYRERGGSAIVQTTIALAHHLGMDAVAEGIETQQQYSRLKELGCEFGQGYFFSRPLDLQQATQFLDSIF
ncbi:MAG: EAL domain-containing protein [Cyanobacteria bacterium SBLK]|nr:EAL domain-containing protein [Cyanobacteria bacterium SBLK]